MAKKILSIVIAAVMLMSTFAVSGLAITDYKKEIDTKFLHAYDSGTYDEATRDRTLYFWDDEVIADYKAASTQADYEALYNKMMLPADWDGNDPEEDPYWYLNRAEQKAQVSYNMVVSNPTAKAGETVTLSVYGTANYWVCQSICIGVMYDKTRLTATSMSMGNFTGWEETMQLLDYGFVGTRDWRNTLWPKSLLTTEAKAKYGAVRYDANPDASLDPWIPALWYDNTLLATFTFTVKADAPEGAATFFIPEDGWPSDIASATAAFDNDEQFLNSAPHGVASGSDAFIDQTYMCGQTFTSNSPSVTVVGDVQNADYSALDTATQFYDSKVASKDIYTAESWAAYETAATNGKNLARDLTADSQSTVDAATKAITDAKDALVVKEIIAAAPTGTATLNANANINITVAGSPEKVRLVDAELNSTTYTRDQASIVKNGNNEVWTIKYYASKTSEDLTAFVSYDGTSYLTDGKTFTLTAEAGLDLTVHSDAVAGIYEQEGVGYLTSGRHVITFTTSTDVTKIQLVDKAGNTWTYSSATYPISDEGNVRTWTINHNFCQLGACSYTIRTRAKNTSFSTTGDSLNVTVLY